MNRQLSQALRAPNPFSMMRIADPDRPAPTPSAPPDSPFQEAIARLSPRRFAVLELVARGLTNREIASVLAISTNTVKAHLTAVLEALELTNRTEAATAFRDFELGQTP